MQPLAFFLHHKIVGHPELLELSDLAPDLLRVFLRRHVHPVTATVFHRALAQPVTQLQRFQRGRCPRQIMPGKLAPTEAAGGIRYGGQFRAQAR